MADYAQPSGSGPAQRTSWAARGKQRWYRAATISMVVLLGVMKLTGSFSVNDLIREGTTAKRRDCRFDDLPLLRHFAT